MSEIEAQLAEVAAAGDVPALIALCENFELDLGHRALSDEVSLAVYKVHLASYLLAEQLDNARFLWKRLPQAQRNSDPEMCAIWNVGKAMWTKDHASTQGAITGFSWSPPLMGTMMERLQRQHLSRCFAQTAQAYSMVSADSLSVTLGACSPSLLLPCTAPRRSRRPCCSQPPLLSPPACSLCSPLIQAFPSMWCTRWRTLPGGLQIRRLARAWRAAPAALHSTSNQP